MTEQYSVEGDAEYRESAMALINRYLDSLFDGRSDDVLAMYGESAEVIRYEGVLRDKAVHAFTAELVTSRRGGRLISIDRLVAGPDTIGWDATIATVDGPIQTSDVVVLDRDGRFLRHVPTLRGYWGM